MSTPADEPFEPDSDAKRLADFLFEVGHLSFTPRRGFALLGSGPQNVAEHSFRTAIIGFALAKETGIADPVQVAWLCLIHDLPETRVTDLDPLAKRYVSVDAHRALADQLKGLGFQQDVAQAWENYERGASIESVLAHDADCLELLLTLREQESRGQARAADWLERTVERMQTEQALKLAEAIIGGDPNHWWEAATTNEGEEAC